MSEPISAVLTIDTREQRPWLFGSCSSKHVAFERRNEGLKAGDYAARLVDEDAPEHTAIVERKSHPDLLGTLTAGRERFEAELERLRPYGYKALVIEATLRDIANYKGLSGQINPKSIVASLVAFAQRFNVHVIFAGNRDYAEHYAFRLLERWVRDRAAARKPQEVTA